MDICILICLQTLTIAMTTRSKTKLANIFLENQFQFEREQTTKMTYASWALSFQVRQSSRQSFAVTITKNTNECLKLKLQ